jgi:hypothetical protein
LFAFREYNGNASVVSRYRPFPLVFVVDCIVIGPFVTSTVKNAGLYATRPVGVKYDATDVVAANTVIGDANVAVTQPVAEPLTTSPGRDPPGEHAPGLVEVVRW